jgi:hypothetical protein
VSQPNVSVSAPVACGLSWGLNMFVVATSESRRLRKFCILVGVLLFAVVSPAAIGALLTIRIYVKPRTARHGVRLFGLRLTREPRPPRLA